MRPTMKNEAKCQGALDALTECVTSTRTPYSRILNAKARKDQLNEVDRRIQLLSDTFSDLMVELKRERNHYLPVNRLVDELLIAIWAYTDLPDRFAISQTSSRWRQLALSATSLWTLIDLEQSHAPRLRHLLERSGFSPLHLVVGVKKPYNRAKPLLGASLKPRSFAIYNYRLLDSHVAYPIASALNQPMSFLTQNEFDGIVGRCATLDAFLGETKLFYVTPQTLSTPMPYLKTLRLMVDSTPRRFGPHINPPVTITMENVPFPLFRKETPQLRELYFDRIHANWEDPIYQNLTTLCISFPKQRASVPQILRILAACPRISNLDLTQCLKPGTPLTGCDTLELDNGPVVSLLRMNHFHLIDSDSVSMANLLLSLSFPSLGFLYLGSSGNSCFTDPYGRPIQSLLPIIENPTDLLISGYRGAYVLQGLNRNQKARENGIQSGRWAHQLRETVPTQLLHPLPPPAFPPQLPSLPTAVMGATGNMNLAINQMAQINTNPPTGGGISGWSATALALGTPGPGAHVLQQTIMMGQGSINFVDLLEQASLGGLQFTQIERLDFNDGPYFMDTVYLDIFSRCEGIQILKVSYNKGIGILTTIMKDKLCPMLTEVYLHGVQSFPGIPVAPISLSPVLLAEWVESRRESSNCRRLKKVTVQFYDSDHITLDENTRERIQNGLGDEGVFIWRTIWSQIGQLRQEWERLVEGDVDPTQRSSEFDGRDDMDASNNATKEKPEYLVQSEWPLSFSMPVPLNAGPW